LTKRAALLPFVLFFFLLAKGQNIPDSVRKTDTLAASVKAPADTSVAPVIRKTVRIRPDTPVVYHTDSLRFSAKRTTDFSRLPVAWMVILESQPHFNFTGKALHVTSERYEPESRDLTFYLLVALLFYFALVRFFFGKYLGNLMTLFFRASMRQAQLREQVIQAPFPSLLLNILFIINGGLYTSFLLKYFHYGSDNAYWIHFFYCSGLLAALYLLKFLVLRLVGWIFNINRAAETYLFVVFMTNKIIGVFLLPFLVLVSFAGPFLTDVSVTLSVIMIVIFYLYRFVSSYSALHKEIKISGLQFILYLCAFEIAPLILIYKVLVSYLEKAY
jgi:hypothetical protein